MKSGYSDEGFGNAADHASEKSDEDLEEDGERLVTPDMTGGVAGGSRNSSLSSGYEDQQHFHVMRRRNAFIQMDVTSVNDPQDLSKPSSVTLIPPCSASGSSGACGGGGRSRQFSIQF